jgi:hypothetical protein
LVEIPNEKSINSLVNVIISIFRSRTRRNQLETVLKNREKFNELLKPITQLKMDAVSYCNLLNSPLNNYFIKKKIKFY